MLVHRDNDDQSGGDLPGQHGKPQLVAQDTAGDALFEQTVDSGDTAREDGKTHLIGDALKSVYQRTLEEDIPDDFLDLLKQLK